MSKMLERAAMAGDQEDSAQRGEPSPWDEGRFPRGEEGWPEWRLERLAVYSCALRAALDPEDDDLASVIARAIAENDATPQRFESQTAADKRVARAAIAALRDHANQAEGG